jgi:hypothetical protein
VGKKRINNCWLAVGCTSMLLSILWTFHFLLPSCDLWTMFLLVSTDWYVFCVYVTCSQQHRTKSCNLRTRPVHNVYTTYTLNEDRTNDYRLAFRATSAMVWILEDRCYKFCKEKSVSSDYMHLWYHKLHQSATLKSCKEIGKCLYQNFANYKLFTFSQSNEYRY